MRHDWLVIEMMKPCNRKHPALTCAALWRLVGVVLALACWSGAVLAQTSGELTGESLIAELRRGGYNLYVRHAATDWSQSDHIRKQGDWTSCDPQKVRQLSETGRRAARAAGQAIWSLRIPIGQVYASPYCRTVETARLMGRGPVDTTRDLMNLRSAQYVGGRTATVERARARLSATPAPGGNTLLVAHGNLARAATGVSPGEGEALIFRPLAAGRFELVGRLTPEAWARLADRFGRKP